MYGYFNERNCKTEDLALEVWISFILQISPKIFKQRKHKDFCPDCIDPKFWQTQIVRTISNSQLLFALITIIIDFGLKKKINNKNAFCTPINFEAALILIIGCCCC